MRLYRRIAYGEIEVATVLGLHDVEVVDVHVASVWRTV